MCVTILFSKPSLVRAEQKSGRSDLEKKNLGSLIRFITILHEFWTLWYNLNRPVKVFCVLKLVTRFQNVSSPQTALYHAQNCRRQSRSLRMLDFLRCARDSPACLLDSAESCDETPDMTLNLLDGRCCMIIPVIPVLPIDCCALR